MENDSSKIIRARELLTEANTVRLDRGETYGHPYYMMVLTAKFWSAYLNTVITPDQVAVMNSLQKVGRLAQTSGFENKDSYVDAIGYLAIAGECSTYQAWLDDDDYS